MSPVSLTLDLLLAGLLLLTLIFGLRLDKRLKTLNASQAEFQAAIADLDRAAARAETGLAELRTAMDEAVDLLGGRIDKARELAAKLETLTTQAQRAGERAATAPATPAGGQRSGLDRVWTRPPEHGSAPGSTRREPEPPLTLTRRDAVPPPRQAPAPAPRSRAAVDDELFDAPALRRVAGARS
ncbi:MAG TPA: DUF6468 domain-containing protein [Caulobacteraceae bacterium]|nr:DUF6468 domain-containing protein [Caulobacteraceae bacterium]